MRTRDLILATVRFCWGDSGLRFEGECSKWEREAISPVTQLSDCWSLHSSLQSCCSCRRGGEDMCDGGDGFVMMRQSNRQLFSASSSWMVWKWNRVLELGALWRVIHGPHFHGIRTLCSFSTGTFHKPQFSVDWRPFKSNAHVPWALLHP